MICMLVELLAGWFGTAVTREHPVAFWIMLALVFATVLLILFSLIL